MIGLLHCLSYCWGNTRTGFDLLLRLTLLRLSPNVGKESAVFDLTGGMMSEGNRASKSCEGLCFVPGAVECAKEQKTTARAGGQVVLRSNELEEVNNGQRRSYKGLLKRTANWFGDMPP